MKRLLQASIKILVICFSLTLVHCEKDDVFEESITKHQKKSNVNTTKVSLDAIKQNSKLKKSLNAIKKYFKSNDKDVEHSRIISTDGSFSVLTDEILKTTSDSTETYTFKIESPFLEGVSFQNLVIDVTNQEANFNLVNYYEKENAAPGTFPYEITFLPLSEEDIELGGFIDIISSKFTTVIVVGEFEYTLEWFCADCGSGGGGGHWQVVSIKYIGENSNGGDGNNSGGGDVGGGSNNTSSGTDTQPYGGGNNGEPSLDDINNTGTGTTNSGSNTSNDAPAPFTVNDFVPYDQQIIACFGPSAIGNTNTTLEDWLGNATYLQTKNMATFLNKNNCNQEAKDLAAEAMEAINDQTNDINTWEDFVAQEIVENIDHAELDDCEEDILDDLKDLEQSDIAEIIKRFGDVNAPYKLKMKSEAFQNNGDRGSTYWQKDNANSPIPYKYLIKLNPNPAHATKLLRAQAMIHEIIHAYFLSVVDDYLQTGDDTLANDFPILWDWYQVKKYGDDDANSPHHETLALLYVDIMARALQEYQTGTPVPTDVEPETVYKDLAWVGLRNTKPYLNESNNPNLPNDSDRLRIGDRIFAELTNNTIINEVPLGGQCD